MLPDLSSLFWGLVGGVIVNVLANEASRRLERWLRRKDQ